MHHVPSGKIYIDPGAFAGNGFEPYGMGQMAEDLPAQIKTQTCGFFIKAAVIACESLFSQTRYVFGLYAYSRVFYDESLRADGIYGYGTAFRVLEGIGEYLFYDELKPFLVSDNRYVHGSYVELYLFGDEKRSIFPDGLLYNRQKLILLKEIIGCFGFKAYV